ncbi:MAG: hypothetical protein QOJ35_3852 [Solirubrobacteraceae bacterium]|jgi:hypothetical protein|nr:hypothetical protein [Solirubrobacteraceae bacterium]
MDPMSWALAMYLAFFARVLVHEFGHALVALGLTDRPVLVLLGRPLTMARVGRLSLGLGLGMTGGVCYATPSTAHARAAIAAAGPAASLVMSLCAGGGFVLAAGGSARTFFGAFLALTAAFAMLDVVLSGWPRAGVRHAYGPGTSDGYDVALAMGWLAPPAPTAEIDPTTMPTAAAAQRAPRPTTRPWAFVALAIIAAAAALIVVIDAFVDPAQALGVAVISTLAWLAWRERNVTDRLTETDSRPPQPTLSTPPPRSDESTPSRL